MRLDFAACDPFSLGICPCQTSRREPNLAIFDAPVATPMLQEKGRIRLFAGKAGDGVLDFDRRVAMALGRAFEMENLGQAGPVGISGQPRAGLQVAMNRAAVPLAVCVSFRKRRLSLLLSSGGKVRAENPQSP